MSESATDLQKLGIRKSKKRSLGFRVGVGIVVAALIALAAFAFVRSRAPSGARYETQEIARGDLVVTVTATGTLRATNTVQIGSEVSGRVARVLVEPNAEVHRGDTLVELEPDQLRATVREARANVAVAQATLRVARANAASAERTRTRLLALRDRSLSSQADFEQADAAYQTASAEAASAAARLAVAGATLERAEDSLNKVVIVSPIDGVVLTRSVEPGQTLAAQFQTPTLLEVAEDLRSMRLELDIDEADIGRVQPAQTARFTVDAYPDREFTGRIARVDWAPRTVNSVVTYLAVVEVENPERLLRPGMTATATVETARERNALLVPNEALRWNPPREGSFGPPAGRSAGTPEGPHVWVLQNNAPVARVVRTIGSDGVRTAVVGATGIEEGTDVIVGVPSPRP